MSEQESDIPAVVDENPLATLPAGGIPSVASEEALDKAITSGKYLPRLQLMTANADKCKSGEFPVNHYALVRDSAYVDLGEEIDVQLISVRPKALDIGEVVLSCFDPENPTFQAIQDRSDNKIGKAMYGLEFLVWMNEQAIFATLFLGSPSSRRETPVFKAILGQKVTCKSFQAHNAKFKWFVPTCVACSTPFESSPTPEDFDEVVQRFLNPPKSEVESATADEQEDQGRAR